MSRIITVTNQKGGTGKTTTTSSLSAGLYRNGYKPLLIDLDPQGNLSYSTGAEEEGLTVLSVLMNECKAQEAVKHTPCGDIIVSSKALAGADAFIKDTGKEYRLREAIESLRSSYDFILIDTPPSLGILTVNALTASDEVIIPAQADIFSLQGITQLVETIKTVKKYCNPSLTISGIVLTRYSNRSIISRDISDLSKSVAESLGTMVYNNTIREAVAVREAQVMRQSIFDYSPSSKVAEDYMNLMDEILKQGKVN